MRGGLFNWRYAMYAMLAFASEMDLHDPRSFYRRKRKSKGMRKHIRRVKAEQRRREGRK